jgi:hypothetical protein
MLASGGLMCLLQADPEEGRIPFARRLQRRLLSSRARSWMLPTLRSLSLIPLSSYEVTR